MAMSRARVGLLRRLLSSGRKADAVTPSMAPSTTVRVSTKWSETQAVREDQMTGVRFVAADKAAQPMPTPAIDLISEIKIIDVPSRKAVCDGGGGPLGHPRIYINLDHGIGTCIYCGLQYRQSHDHHEH